MKRMILALLLLVVTLTFVLVSAVNGMTEKTYREEAIVEFTETVKLQGVLLRGQYLVYHDDVKMAEGESCLYIYTMKAGKRDKLVASLHCEPVERKITTQFTVTLSPRTIYGVPEIREIQFAGIPKAHRIPG